MAVSGTRTPAPAEGSRGNGAPWPAATRPEGWQNTVREKTRHVFHVFRVFTLACTAVLSSLRHARTTLRDRAPGARPGASPRHDERAGESPGFRWRTRGVRCGCSSCQGRGSVPDARGEISHSDWKRPLERERYHPRPGGLRRRCGANTRARLSHLVRARSVRSRPRLRACLARHTPPGTVFPAARFLLQSCHAKRRNIGEPS